jgi:hypothetical protein
MGPLLFPTPVTAALVIRGATVAAIAMLLAGLLLGARGKHDRITGALLVAAYLGAYVHLLAGLGG